MQTEVERFVFLNPPGILGIILISFLFIIVLYSTIRSVRQLMSLKKKITLTFLRLASFFLIVFILLNPALRAENYREEKPRLAILIDYSWSMNLAGDEKGTPRIQSIRDFLKRHETFFSEIEENFLVYYYVFDDAIQPASLDFININDPNGKDTNIGKVIKELLEEKHNLDKPDSIILFSDGADRGRLLDSTDELLKEIGVPINTVGFALNKEVPDIWIDSVKVSDVAFVRYPLGIDVAVKSIGFKPTSIPVTLKEGDRVISIEEVPIDPVSKDAKVRFTFTPKSIGRKVYTVSIPVLSGELIRENNQKSFVVDVIIDKIRVLHIAGSPSWDVRFLRKALKRNPNVDLVAFFILREASDLVFASQNELSLIPFPVDEIFGKELETFDVVIFQNFDFRPYGIYGYHLKRLRDYVAEDGGAFLMIGGDKSFGSGGYGGTPISEILPVELDYIPTQQAFSKTELQAKLTEIGARHPVMKIIPNQEENKKGWEEMPELDGLNKAEGLKPNAIPLLVTPEGDPILVLNQAGSGKVASFLSDSSWKWSFVRSGEGEAYPYYEKFWNRLLLWLVNDPELKDIRVKTDKASYNPGEKPKVDVWTSTHENSGPEIESLLTLPSSTLVELNLEKTSDDRFSAEMKAEEYGVYRVKVHLGGEDSNVESDSNRDETVFLVEPPEKELKGPTLDENLLKTIAEKTGGRFITVKDNPKELGIDFSPKRTITGYKTVQIWDNPWVLMVLLALFSSEWILRRRWGLR
jgi:uncharacterized membrane protein